jgi:hydrogenase maturation protease
MNLSSSSAVAIFGLGNALMTDDGVGVHALWLLREQAIPGVDLWEAGTQSLHAADIAMDYDRIVLIDAVKTGQPPGTIYHIERPQPVKEPGPVSLHSIDMFAAGALVKGLSAEVILVGVEPETVAYGTTLSPCVAAALPELCRLAIQAARAEPVSVECAA